MADEEVLQIPKSQAIALFEGLGFKTAKKWDCDKLTEKINAIEEAPDEPFDDPDLDELMDNLMEAEEAVVFDDTDEETPEDEDDEDFEEKKEEPKPKSKKKDKKAAKKEKPKTKSKAPAKKNGESIDQITLDLLKAKPMKLEALHKAVCKKFPEHDEEALLRTTKRRLTGHLANKFGVEIVKDEKGTYSVEE